MSERCEVCGRHPMDCWADGSSAGRAHCYRDRWKEEAEKWACREAYQVEQGIRVAADWLSEKQALEAERDRLREALREYGEHFVRCQSDGVLPCDCGYETLLTAPSAPSDERGQK